MCFACLLQFLDNLFDCLSISFCYHYLPTFFCAFWCAAEKVDPARISLRIKSMCFFVWWTLCLFSVSFCLLVSVFLTIIFSTPCHCISTACDWALAVSLDCVQPLDAFSSARQIEHSKRCPLVCQLLPLVHRLWLDQLAHSWPFFCQPSLHGLFL